MRKDELYQISGFQIKEWLLDCFFFNEDMLERLSTMDADDLREFALDFCE